MPSLKDDVPDDFVLPDGDITRGALIFKKYCAQCHSIRADNRVLTGRTLVGPNLNSVYGRTSGVDMQDCVSGVSREMQEAGIVWNDVALMRYCKNPRLFTQSAIYMNFRGIQDFNERVDLVCYLKAVALKQLPESKIEEEIVNVKKQHFYQNYVNAVKSFWK